MLHRRRVATRWAEERTGQEHFHCWQQERTSLSQWHETTFPAARTPICALDRRAEGEGKGKDWGGVGVGSGVLVSSGASNVWKGMEDRRGGRVEGDNMLICCLLSIAQINWTPFDLLFPLNLSIDLFSQKITVFVDDG